MFTNGWREEETSGDREIEGRLPNTTLLTLTLYLEFAPIKIPNEKQLQEEKNHKNTSYMSFNLDPVMSL